MDLPIATGTCATDGDAARGNSASTSSVAPAAAARLPFTPTIINRNKCMGRTYAGTQCRNGRVPPGDACKKHVDFRFGRVDGEIPPAGLHEFTRRLPEVVLGAEHVEQSSVTSSAHALGSDRVPQGSVLKRRRLDCSGDSDRTRASASLPSYLGHVPAPGENAVHVISARPERARRSNIVTGFDVRVDDVAADEERRIAEGARRGDQRRTLGTRGRMTDLSGADLDRAAGSAFSLGRR